MSSFYIPCSNYVIKRASFNVPFQGKNLTKHNWNNNMNKHNEDDCMDDDDNDGNDDDNENNEDDNNSNDNLDDDDDEFNWRRSLKWPKLLDIKKTI